MTPRQREAVEALEKYGSQSEAARALGLTRSGLQGLLRNAKITPEDKARLYKGASLSVARAMDPAIDEAMKAIGMGVVPSTAWIKTKPTKDQPGYSLMLRPAERSP